MAFICIYTNCSMQLGGGMNAVTLQLQMHCVLTNHNKQFVSLHQTRHGCATQQNQSNFTANQKHVWAEPLCKCTALPTK